MSVRDAKALQATPLETPTDLKPSAYPLRAHWLPRVLRSPVTTTSRRRQRWYRFHIALSFRRSLHRV
jgi:hypothetical protein